MPYVILHIRIQQVCDWICCSTFSHQLRNNGGQYENSNEKDRIFLKNCLSFENDSNGLFHCSRWIHLVYLPFSSSKTINLVQVGIRAFQMFELLKGKEQKLRNLTKLKLFYPLVKNINQTIFPFQTKCNKFNWKLNFFMLFPTFI